MFLEVTNGSNQWQQYVRYSSQVFFNTEPTIDAP
jgi:hypothetical protein